MIEQVLFYVKHSLNDMRVNGRRTFFAILAVAAGVAAIVSLQTVAVLIGDTLTGNLQEQNRSDIQISPPILFPDEADVPDEFRTDQTLVDDALAAGYLQKTSAVTMFGDEGEVYYTSQGITAIQDWLDENYPGQAEITYRVAITSMVEIFTNTGDGTVVSVVGTDAQVSQVVPIVVDAAVYPYYDTIESVDGEALADLLTGPNDVVLSRNLAADLKASVGDTVRLRGASEDITVTGIVPSEAGAAEPTIGLFGAIFGFYYLDESALPLFNNHALTADVLFLRLNDPALTDQVNTALAQKFGFIRTTTTEDLREQNVELADNLDLLVTVMGLLSLLIGSIGIINTMQVVVRRRTIEIAVLKTVGLQANQVTLLFLMEAFLMGVIGSLVGIVLGWGATFIIKSAADVLTPKPIAFHIALAPAVNGLIVGTLVTTVFGFMPTLSAGQVRPGVVLRPNDEIVPRAGILRSLGAIVVMIVVLAVITQTILGGSLLLALQVVGGAFVAAGILFVLLLFIIWLIGRLFPSLGIIDLKISLRQMLTTRGRGAITLLALVVGIFVLSMITMMTESVTNLLSFAIEESSKGNVVVQASPNTIDQIVQTLDGLDVVNSYWVDRTYSLELSSVEKVDTGEVVDIEALQSQVARAMTADAKIPEAVNVGSLANQLNTVAALDDSQIEEETMTAGRQLSPDDTGQPYITIQNSPEVEAAGLQVGDKLNYTVGGDGLFGAGDQSYQMEIIGITEAPDTGGIIINTGFGSHNLALVSAFPEDWQPDSLSVQVDIAEENVPQLREAVANIPGALVFELSLIVNLVQSLVDQFRVFPTLVAALGLAIGGIVIANSVALATMERRREIAIMKSIGLQRERVLAMLLLENAILGFIGGLIGVGIGLLALFILSIASDIPTSTIPIGTGLLLMLLCVVVAIIAAATTAWGASGEKPLNVLRYE